MAGSKKRSELSQKPPPSPETEYPAILRTPKTPPPPERYAAIRKDWDTTPLPPKLHYARLLTRLPWIPSPMADTTAKEREGAIMSAAVKPDAQLFRSAYSARMRPRVLGDLRPIREFINEVEERALYYVRNHPNPQYLETYKSQAYEDSDDESEAMTVNIHSNGRFNVVKLPCTIHIGIMRRHLYTPRSPAKPGFSDRRLGAAVRFYALRERKTGVVGHFVANDVHERFLVNEAMVPKSTVIGPLSDFSVIQVGDDVAFWWQNRQGLDYKPPSDGDPRPSDNAICPDKKLGTKSPKRPNEDVKNLVPKPPKRPNNDNKKLGPKSPKRPKDDGKNLGPKSPKHNDDKKLGPKSPKRPKDDEDSTKEESGPKTKKPRSGSDPTVENSQHGQTSASYPQSWEDMFQSGFERWYGSWKAEQKNLRATKGKDPKANPQWERRCIVSREGGWDNMSVVNAIATIWAPLGMRHGYGTSQVFEIRDRATQVDWQRLGNGRQSTACGQYKDKFIIPLHLLSVQQQQKLYNIGEERNEGSSKRGKGKDKIQTSPGRQMTATSNSKAEALGGDPSKLAPKSQHGSVTTKNKGKARVKTEDEENIGHFVLAVATRADSKPITIQIWDSSPGTVARADIEQAARGVVTYSGWMGMSLNSRVWDHDPPLDFGRIAFERTPHQGIGNLCGLYTVLNAWANMLGIQVRKQRELRLPKEKTLDDFHRRGTDIVNLALAGHMDSRTIQAFLKVYGYSVGQDLNKLVENVQAIRMDDDILDERVTNQKIYDDAETQKKVVTYGGPWLY